MPSKTPSRLSLCLKSSTAWGSERWRQSTRSVISSRACSWAFFGALSLCKRRSPLPPFCFSRARFSYFGFEADEFLRAGERRLFAGRHRTRPLRDGDPAVGFQLNRGSVKSEQFAPPPHSVLFFFRHGSKPVLPEDRAHLVWRPLRKRIGGKQREHVRIVGEQPSLGAQHHGVVAPLAERCEPQIPIQSRLIGRVNARRFV